MMVPLPPGWLCLQDCNLSGQLNQPVVVPFVLLHPDVGVALIDVAPVSNPEAEAILRRRLEAARFGSIFPGFLPILHLRLDRADLPSTEAILRDAFASMPPLSVPGGDGWVSVVRRALLPRDPARASTPVHRPSRIAEPARGPDAEGEMLHREAAARAAAKPSFESAAPDLAARPTPPIIWVIMSGVGGLLAVLALFTLLGSGPDTRNPAEEAAGVPPAASVAPPAAPPLGAPPVGAPPPAPAPAPTSTASHSPKPPPVVAPPPPPAVASVPPQAQPTPAATPPDAYAGASAAPAPAQRPAPTAADRLPRVTVRQPANLRTSPDSQANIVRVVPRGETLRVHSRTGNGWLLVGDAEPRGWLHTSRLGDVE